MNNIAIFDAKSWIIGSCPGADALRPETLDVVSNFTLMWNLFEDALCNNKAKVDAFDNIAKEIALRGLPDDVKAGIEFWANRYRTGPKFNELFADLHFRRDDRKELVIEVLSGLRNDPHSHLLAVMIIIYRLRNNLFHGLKSIPTLNDQVANLDMACRALAAIVQASV